MKARHIVIPLLLAGAAYATVALVRQAKLIKQSCVKFLAYRFEKLTVQYARLVVQLQVKNNSTIDLTLRAQKFDVYINNEFVSRVKSRIDVNLPAQTPAVVELVIEFDPRKVLKGAVNSLLSAAGDILINVKGSITAISSAIVISNIKIDETISLGKILSQGNKNNNC